MTKVDIVIDAALGDSSKAKITYEYLKHGSYTHVAVTSGGPNRGHTIYKDDKKFVFHQVPCGVLNNVASVIGAGCVIDVQKLFHETEQLEQNGVSVYNNLKIAYNAHIITEDMIKEDMGGGSIGSTSCGIMQAYRAKYGRSGIRAESIKELKPFLVDTLSLFHDNECNVLVEGSQGFMLCPDWGFYPYVTSGIPTATYALHSLGLNIKNLNLVIGCMKAYNTYSGNRDDFERGSEEDKKIYEKIVELGQERGNTTGRTRKICWNDMKDLRRAILANGIDTIVVSKMDILLELGIWKVFDETGSLISFSSEDKYVSYLNKFFKKNGINKIHYSYTPLSI